MHTSPATTQTLTQTCPLNDGFAVLDQLMAGLSPEHESQALDLALDLRCALRSHAPAETVIAIFLALRRAAEERHYLPCYRLRSWLQSHLQAWVRLGRRQPALPVSLRLDQLDLNALREHCYASAATAWQPGATVHFDYVANPVR